MDLYQWLASVDTLLTIEFSNNSFKFRHVDNNFIQLYEVFDDFQQLINNIYATNEDDLTLKKIHNMLNEMALLKS